MNQLYKQIAKMREEAELSPAELAERSGLSQAYISKLEDGEYKSLSLNTCKSLAEGFGLTLKVFLEEVGFLSNRDKERPSFQMISNALRSNGYTPKEVEEIVKYARYVKQQPKTGE